MNSPFKFLDPYEIGDKKIFFGRDAEIDALYTLVFQTRLVLVYGGSGTGKTSIIQCGLANRFKPTDWFPVFVRRKDDINASLDREIRRLAPTPIKAGVGVVKATHSLYLDHLRPIYFIFDQFEELFILGSADEQAAFFGQVRALLESDLNARIIISMREEYIAMLQGFEKAVPMLFAKRLRIEPMTPANIEAVITGTVAAAGIGLENGSATAQRIIERISDRRSGVALAYLQVYLDTLYRAAAKTPTPLVFTDALIDATGGLGDVMADFLDQQTATIETGLAGRHGTLARGSVQRILEEMTTIEGTKAPVSRASLVARLPALAPLVGEALAALEASRIVRNADDVFELAHDSLGHRIAERRSAENKELLRIRKTVRDGLDKYAGQAKRKTYLVAEDLAEVLPVLPKLELSPDEAAFVEKSRVKLRWHKTRVIGATLGIVAVLVVLLLLAVAFAWESVETVEKAVETTGALSQTLADDQEKLVMQQRLLGHLKALIKDLEEVDSLATGDTGFWLEIVDGEIQQQNENWTGARAKFNTALKKAESSRVEQMEGRLQSAANWDRNKSIALGRLAALSEAQAYAEGVSADEKAKHLDEARRRYRQALVIDQAQYADDVRNPVALHDLMLSHGALAQLEYDAEDYAAARRSVEAALVVSDDLDAAANDPAYVADAAADPAIAEAEARDRRLWAADHGDNLMLLGDIEWMSENFDKAIAAYIASAAIYSRIADAEPSRRDWRIEAVAAHFNAAAGARVIEDWATALAENGRAQAQLQRLVRKVPKQADRKASGDSVDAAQKQWAVLIAEQRRQIQQRNNTDFSWPDV